MKIAIAQINCTVGDLAGNAAKIADYTQRAKAQGAARGVVKAANRISQRRIQPPIPEDGSAGSARIAAIPGARVPPGASSGKRSFLAASSPARSLAISARQSSHSRTCLSRRAAFRTGRRPSR